MWWKPSTGKENTNTPWIIARARMPPVLVPATQSKSSLVGLPASFSRAISIWISTRPLIPPPSRHSRLSILSDGQDQYDEFYPANHLHIQLFRSSGTEQNPRNRVYWKESCDQQTKHHNTENSKIKQSKVNLERKALNACRSKPTNGKEIKEGRGFQCILNNGITTLWNLLLCSTEQQKCFDPGFFLKVSCGCISYTLYNNMNY